MFTFAKMHGLGNDFIVINALTQPFSLTPKRIAELAHRYTGIGFDQLLIIEPPNRPDVDFSYRIFNGDGGEVEHCGNGARCFAHYLRLNDLHDFRKPVRVSVKRGRILIDYQGENELGESLYRVDMGVPQFSPQPDLRLQSALAAGERDFGCVSMGNPHAVTWVDDCEDAPVESWGKALQSHDAFPERVNVGFMEKVNDERVRLRVFERGVGETLACGTGACAAVATGIRQKQLAERVSVTLRGGELIIEWQGEGYPLFMTGAAALVFYGQIPDEC
ncbi:MAG: diaminopimelate epimerase [Cardiobacteriaceae bacterium]|nr:diaminopimelate epimerase [Cardiobacteriaceae bacterium]